MYTLDGLGSFTSVLKMNTETFEPLDLHDFVGFSGSSEYREPFSEVTSGHFREKFNILNF